MKEEKLAIDAVKHLNDANLQINSLSKRIIGQSDESQKQKEKIAILLSQVIFKIFMTDDSDDLKLSPLKPIFFFF